MPTTSGEAAAPAAAQTTAGDSGAARQGDAAPAGDAPFPTVPVHGRVDTLLPFDELDGEAGEKAGAVLADRLKLETNWDAAAGATFHALALANPPKGEVASKEQWTAMLKGIEIGFDNASVETALQLLVPFALATSAPGDVDIAPCAQAAAATLGKAFGRGNEEAVYGQAAISSLVHLAQSRSHTGYHLEWAAGRLLHVTDTTTCGYLCHALKVAGPELRTIRLVASVAKHLPKTRGGANGNLDAAATACKAGLEQYIGEGGFQALIASKSKHRIGLSEALSAVWAFKVAFKPFAGVTRLLRSAALNTVLEPCLLHRLFKLGKQKFMSTTASAVFAAPLGLRLPPGAAMLEHLKCETPHSMPAGLASACTLEAFIKELATLAVSSVVLRPIAEPDTLWAIMRILASSSVHPSGAAGGIRRLLQAMLADTGGHNIIIASAVRWCLLQIASGRAGTYQVFLEQELGEIPFSTVAQILSMQSAPEQSMVVLHRWLELLGTRGTNDGVEDRSSEVAEAAEWLSRSAEGTATGSGEAAVVSGEVGATVLSQLLAGAVATQHAVDAPDAVLQRAITMMSRVAVHMGPVEGIEESLVSALSRRPTVQDLLQQRLLGCVAAMPEEEEASLAIVLPLHAALAATAGYTLVEVSPAGLQAHDDGTDSSVPFAVDLRCALALIQGATPVRPLHAAMALEVLRALGGVLSCDVGAVAALLEGARGDLISLSTAIDGVKQTFPDFQGLHAAGREYESVFDDDAQSDTVDLDQHPDPAQVVKPVAPLPSQRTSKVFTALARTQWAMAKTDTDRVIAAAIGYSHAEGSAGLLSLGVEQAVVESTASAIHIMWLFQCLEVARSRIEVVLAQQDELGISRRTRSETQDLLSHIREAERALGADDAPTKSQAQVSAVCQPTGEPRDAADGHLAPRTEAAPSLTQGRQAPAEDASTILAALLGAAPTPGSGHDADPTM